MFFAKKVFVSEVYDELKERDVYTIYLPAISLCT